MQARCYSNLKPFLLQDMLSEEDNVWHYHLSFDDINDCSLCFTTVLEGLLDLLTSLCKIRTKQNVNPWANSDITAALHHKYRLYHKALLYGFQSD